jgi:anti-sigma regulatory factor (Ser/Thr protein kinase)
LDPSSTDTREVPDLLSEGGRGLFLMTRLMDALEFRFDAGCEVTMRRRLALALDAAPGDSPVVEH